MAPIPPAQWRKKLRRVWIWRNWWRSISLFSAYKFVQVEQDAAEADPVLLLVEVSGDPVLLARRGFTAKAQLECVIQLRIEARAGRLLLDAFGERAGGFEEHRVVEQVERLQGSIRDSPPCARQVRIRLVEVGQEWIRRGAL